MKLKSVIHRPEDGESVMAIADGFNGHHYYTLTEKGEKYNGN